MADLFQQLQQNGPSAPAPVPSAPSGQPFTTPTPIQSAKSQKGFDPVKEALAERVAEFKKSNLHKLTGGKQVNIDVDIFDSLVRKGTVRLFRGVMNSASLAVTASNKLVEGADYVGQALGSKLSGKDFQYKKSKSTKFIEDVAEQVREFGMTQAMKNVHENDKVADMLEGMGRTEEAEQMREYGKVLTVEGMTDDEVLDMLDPPGAMRSFMTGMAELLPEFAVSSKFTLPSRALGPGKNLIGKAANAALSEAPAAAVFTLLERDPSSPAGKQISQAAKDVAIFSGFAAGMPLLTAGSKVAFTKSKDLVAKTLMKRHVGEALTKGEEQLILRSTAAKRMMGEPVTKKAEEAVAYNKYLKDFVKKYTSPKELADDLKNGKVIEIPLNEILPDELIMKDIQLAEKMGKKFPYPAPQGFADKPIEVILPGGKGGSKFYIQDGIHRYMQAYNSGQKTIKAIVKDADEKQLLEYFTSQKSVTAVANAELRDVELMFRATEKVADPFYKKVTGGTKDLLQKAHDNLINRFQPLARMEKELFKAQGQSQPKLNLAQKFEQTAGAVGKAESDIIRFQKNVTDHVMGMTDEFNQYLFLKRTIARLEDNAKLKGVSKRVTNPDGSSRTVIWTVEKANKALQQLRQEVGEQAFATLEITGKNYHSFMDDVLRLQVEAGRLSDEAYQNIRAHNPFYAPFKIIGDLEKLELEVAAGLKGTGKNISTTAKLTRAIRGAKLDDDFFIDDILEASVNQVYKSRILAEKNLKMLELKKYINMPGAEKWMQELAGEAKPPRGWQTVHLFDAGKDLRLAVNPEMAKAIQGLDKQLTGFFANVLRIGAVPLRTGATVANVPFQTVNVAFRDPVRQLLLFRYGKSPKEIVKFPVDMARGFYHAMRGNLGDAAGDDLFMQFLQSGAANTSVQRFLTPGAFRRSIKPPKNVVQKYGKKLNVIDNVARFSEALEQTGKMTGWIRGMRDINKKFIIHQNGAKPGSRVNESLMKNNPKYREAVEELVTEVRNYAGSPDFARMGHVGGEVNLMYMFFNARVQGISADIGRLLGRRGAGTASAWAAASTAMLPVLANQMRNQMYFKEDYDNLLDWERKNYIHIFRNKTFINEDGQMVRESFRIPKSEVFGLFSDFIEGSVNFGFDQDPRAASEVAMNMLENIAPVNIDGRNALERFESFLSGMNPIFKVPFEVATGRDMFRHRDVLSAQEEKRSPVNQFGETTPELYKRAGSAVEAVGGPEFLQSPKRLEQLATGLTGGAIRQFEIPKPLEGRSFWSEFFVTKRFFRSPWVNEAETQKEIAELLRKQEDTRFAEGLTAEKKLVELRGMPVSERTAAMYKLSRENPKLLEKVMELSKEDKSGVTYTDRLVKQLGVENGERARYLLQKWTELPQSDRPAFVQEMMKKGIITERVWQQMQTLRKTTP